MTSCSSSRATRLCLAAALVGGVAPAVTTAWFVGKVTLVDATFRGQQRRLGPLYAGALSMRSSRWRLALRSMPSGSCCRAQFAGPVELRVLRARVEASETHFEGHATIGRLDEARPRTRRPRSVTCPAS
jgi:hypothetical protein